MSSKRLASGNGSTTGPIQARDTSTAASVYRVALSRCPNITRASSTPGIGSSDTRTS